MSKNKIIEKRIVYGVHIVLAEPLCISNGDSEETDNDVMVNGNNEPFVPGTSIAGAMRNYLNQKHNEKGMMGCLCKSIQNNQKTESYMSSLTISDMTLFNHDGSKIVLETRDQVKLDNKVAVDEAKFDMQIVPTGVEGVFMCELIIREKDSENEWSNKVKVALNGINNGEIRFGTKKNRGYGSLKIVGIEILEYTKNNLKEWLDFDYKKFVNELKEYEDISILNNIEKNLSKNKYIDICMPLNLDGGISIRKYSTSPGKADFEQITCNGKPVIPGTSWMGAIRGRCEEFLSELGFDFEKRAMYMNKWFGFVKQNKSDSEALQSNIVIGESVIENSKELVVTRNKIDRITNKTVNGALYTEKSYFGGETTLKIKINKNVDLSDALMGLFLLILQDIGNGMLSIGGQTAVGRGIFKGNNIIFIDSDEYNVDSHSLDKYKQALFALTTDKKEVM